MRLTKLLTQFIQLNFQQTVNPSWQRCLSYQYKANCRGSDKPPIKFDGKVVDLRSDVLSKPAPQMMQSMIETASYGDDVFGENTTVNDLESRVAKMLGKEAALFVTSGTMGNLLAMMAHCRTLGCEAIIGDKCHIHLYEQGSLATLARVHHRTAATKADGTLCLDECRRLVRLSPEDPHYPATRVLALENTHGTAGGKVLPVEYFSQARDFCNQYGIKLHLDGARLLNATVASNVELIEYGKYVDSVSICFSKGLGAPIGSCLASDRDTISFCRRLRKALGGGTRQPGILAAVANHALDTAVQTLTADHANAQLIYSGIRSLNLPNWLVFDKPDTNIMLLCITKEAPIGIDALQTLLEEPNQDCQVRLRAPVVSPSAIRMVTHNCLSRGDCEVVVDKMASILPRLRSR